MTKVKVKVLSNYSSEGKWNELRKNEEKIKYESKCIGDGGDCGGGGTRSVFFYYFLIFAFNKEVVCAVMVAKVKVKVSSNNSSAEKWGAYREGEEK